MKHLSIEKVIGREIIDSRGNPTVEAEVYLTDGTVGRGAAPSGASTGEFEALELRDQDKSTLWRKGRFQGSGEYQYRHLRCSERSGCRLMFMLSTQAMIQADGTKDKSNLGANAILAVSIASCKSSSQRTGDAPVPLSWAEQTETVCRCR